ncbi:MAG TPA: phage holin family protein [Nocardioides sp.]|nr:phage holin family protein [Nocardioides sp.]
MSDPTAIRGAPRWGVRGTDVARLLAAWAVSALALAVAAWLLKGLSFDSWWPILAGSALTGALGLVVRPVLVAVVARVGWLAVALAALFGQALIMLAALSVVPGVRFDSFWTVFAAAWLAAMVGTAITWLLSAGTDEGFAASLLHRATSGSGTETGQPAGVVFVQLDGVSYPVLSWALQAGLMPVVRGWVEAGTHAAHEWIVQMPCTTPASQQAILHGTAAGVPAFRWYDRELGRVLVANRPADAAVIEKRASTGRGLLADGGVSISNIFTGDAPRAALTMSRVEVTRGARPTRAAVARYLVRPDGLARSLARTIGEVVRERFQGARQHRLGIRPRIHRSWTFAAMRAVSNGLLRDLNTALVVEEMQRGTPSIYVDYVDYDEVAHHAGATRLESLATLTSLDRVLGTIAMAATSVPRHYHVVVLSDHGQSQGEPFASRYGVDLAGICAELAQASVTGVEQSVEGWGRVGTLADDLAATQGATERLARSVAGRVEAHLETEAETGTEFVVLGSGNLGLVFVPGPVRMLREELEERWPLLLSGLAAHPGVAFVSVLSRTGPVAIGADGTRDLVTGEVDGDDPLQGFGAHAAAMLRDATLLPEAPEVYVNSAVDPGTDEVAAFEPLVGCHGGLGGWQDRGFVLAPPQLLTVEEPILGGVALHRLLVSVLESLGHRGSL